MAKTHTVKIRLEGDSSDAEQSVLGAQRRLAALEKEASDLRREFDKGELSADEFTQSISKIDDEANKVKTALDKAGASTKSVGSRFTTMTKSIRANVVTIVASIASLVVVFRQLEQAAQLRGQTAALKRAVSEQGIEYDAWMAKLKQVSDAQIDTATLIDVSSQAIARNIRAAELPELLEVARAKAIETGKDVTQVFSDLALGIARQSPMIIENAAIIIKLGDAYKAYAEELGKTTEELTSQERTTAVLRATIEAGSSAVDKFGDKQDKMAAQLAQSSARMKDLKTDSLNLATGLLQMTTGGGAAIIVMLSLIAEGAVKVAKGWALIGSLVPGIDGAFKGLADNIQELDDGLDSFQKRTAAFAVDVSKGGVALIKLGVGMEDVADKTERLGTMQRATTQEWQDAQAPLAALIGIHGSAAEAVDAHAAAEERLQEVLEKEAEALKTINDVAAQYGVTIKTELTAALNANAEAQQKVDDALAAGVIEQEDYDRLTKEITKSTKELTDELNGVVDPAKRLAARLEELRERNKDLAESANQAGAGLDSMRDNMDDAADSADKAASAINNVSDATERWQSIEAGPRRTATIGRDIRAGTEAWRQMAGRGGSFGGGGSRSTVTPDGRVEYA